MFDHGYAEARERRFEAEAAWVYQPGKATATKLPGMTTEAVEEHCQDKTETLE
jgi:hypothetical protein